MNYIKLKNVSYFVRNGASIKQSKQCTKGIPITRIETVSNSVFNWDKLGFADILDDKYKEYYLQDKDVLLSHINSARFVGRSVLFEKRDDKPIIHGMNLLCIRFIGEKYNPSFFVWFSKSKLAKNYFEENTKKAVNQASITSTAIKDMPIPDLSIKEQNTIVSTLDKIQKAILIKEQQLIFLDDLVKSEFVEMFGNPIDNDKSFPKKRMTDVCPIQEAKLQIVSDSVCLLNLDMIEQDTGTILDKQIVSMDEVGNSTIQFSSDHVLYSKLRPYLNKVALPDEAGYASSELVPFLPKREINKIYFAYLLRSDSFVELINSKSGGAKMPRASMDFIRKFEIPVPPLDLQNQFAAFVQQIDKSKFVVKQQIADLQELLDSKMQEYFG